MAKSNEPFWWALFSAGMMVGAFVVPALIVITGILYAHGAFAEAICILIAAAIYATMPTAH